MYLSARWTARRSSARALRGKTNTNASARIMRIFLVLIMMVPTTFQVCECFTFHFNHEYTSVHMCVPSTPMAEERFLALKKILHPAFSFIRMT